MDQWSHSNAPPTPPPDVISSHPPPHNAGSIKFFLQGRAAFFKGAISSKNIIKEEV
jgi:hypothetical protein